MHNPPHLSSQSLLALAPPSGLVLAGAPGFYSLPGLPLPSSPGSPGHSPHSSAPVPPPSHPHPHHQPHQQHHQNHQQQHHHHNQHTSFMIEDILGKSETETQTIRRRDRSPSPRSPVDSQIRPTHHQSHRQNHHHPHHSHHRRSPVEVPRHHHSRRSESPGRSPPLPSARGLTPPPPPTRGAGSHSPPPPRPTPVHPAVHPVHPTAVHPSPDSYKPAVLPADPHLLNPALLGYPGLHPAVTHHHPGLAGVHHPVIPMSHPAGQFYALPYGRPEYAFVDRHGAYARGRPNYDTSIQMSLMIIICLILIYLVCDINYEK